MFIVGESRKVFPCEEGVNAYIPATSFGEVDDSMAVAPGTSGFIENGEVVSSFLFPVLYDDHEFICRGGLGIIPVVGPRERDAFSFTGSFHVEWKG